MQSLDLSCSDVRVLLALRLADVCHGYVEVLTLEGVKSVGDVPSTAKVFPGRLELRQSEVSPLFPRSTVFRSRKKDLENFMRRSSGPASYHGRAPDQLSSERSE